MKQTVAPQHPQCLLVVDDQLHARQAVAACLTSAGHRVKVAGNGLDALAAAHGDSPNAVVLDVHVPIAACLATATALHQNIFTTRMKIVLRSAMPEADLRALFPVCDAFVDERSFDALINAIATVGAMPICTPS